jgi:hypothetical protein
MTSGSGPLFLGPEVADWQTVAVVAQPSQPNQPEEPGGRGADFGKSSPVGLLVLLLFFIAVAFLVRSMTKHLKRVPASFDKEPDAASAAEEATEEGPEDKATGTSEDTPVKPVENGAEGKS